MEGVLQCESFLTHFHSRWT